MSWLTRFVGARPVAAIVITAVTALVISGVLLSTTTVACGPAQKAGLKLQQCPRPTAAHMSPTPYGVPSSSPIASFSAQPSQPYNPPATPPDSYCPPTSGPYCPGSSGPYPPQGPGPATGSYPPFNPPATGPGGIAIPTYNLSCRLPIYVGPAGSGGFIVFPGGAFIADPSSAVTLPTPPAGSPGPAQGVPGYYGLTYDSAFTKWLPVPRTWMAPDGAHYAYPSTSSIYAVDIRTNAVTELGQGHVWNIVGVANDAVFAEVIGAPGLWKLPFAGAGTQLTTIGFWQMASPRAAYGTKSSALPNGITTVIIKLDFSTGKIDDNFYSRDGTFSNVVGFDAQGNPLISVSYFAPNGGNEVWLVTSVGPTPLFGSGSGAQGLNLQGTPVGDSHGVWMPLYVQSYQGGTGFGLYVPSSGVFWMSNYSGQLAGGCS
jgi:hypothetical protein